MNNKKWNTFNKHKEIVEKSWVKSHKKKGHSVQFGEKKKEKMRGFSEPLRS